jgi:hypothetical protein
MQDVCVPLHLSLISTETEYDNTQRWQHKTTVDRMLQLLLRIG